MAGRRYLVRLVGADQLAAQRANIRNLQHLVARQLPLDVQVEVVGVGHVILGIDGADEVGTAPRAEKSMWFARRWERVREWVVDLAAFPDILERIRKARIAWADCVPCSPGFQPYGGSSRFCSCASSESRLK